MPQDYIYDDGTVSRGGPRAPGAVGYLDEVYGLPPVGSEGNPMNMPAMRLDEDIGSGQNPMNMEGVDLREGQLRAGETIDDLVPAEGSDQYPMTFPPEDVRAPQKIMHGNGGFVMRRPEPFGPPADAAPRGPAKPEQKKVSSSAAPPAAGPRIGPPPGVVPPVGAGGEEGWDAYMEKPRGQVAAPGVEVDAISGGAMPQPDQGGEGGPDLSWATGHVVMTDEDERRRQAGMSPREQVLDASNREFKRQQIGIDGMAAAAAKQRVDAERNLAALDTARKKTMAEIDAIKKRPGWLASRSSGQKVLLFADAAFSGMLAAFQGSSKNAAIDAMHQSIEEDADERARELAEAHGGLVDAQEMFKFKELARLRSYEDAKQHVLIQMQKYDPRGSMVAQGMAQLQDFDARQAEAETKILEHNWKKQLDLEHIASEERMKAADLAQAERASRRAAGVQYAGQDKEMLKAGFIKGPDGKWIRDPNAPSPFTKDVADIENTLARTRNAKFEAEQHERANVILDPRTQQPLGRPLDFEKRDAVQKNVDAYSILRTQLQDLIDLVKTEGQAGKLTEKRAEIDAARYKVAATYAKIIDPVGAVSDKSIEAADKIVPQADGWIKRWQHPEEVYKTVVRGADQEIELRASSGIEGYKKGAISNQYKAIDEQIFSSEPTRADRIKEATKKLGYPVDDEGEAELPPLFPEPSAAPPPDYEPEDPWEKARKGKQ
jgi:hypothetical protein